MSTVTRKFPFAIVPEWIVYHPDLSDRAVRLWAVLARFGTASGARCPGRTLLAQLCGACSVDSIDRAKAELVKAGALKVEQRFTPGAKLANEQKTNHYELIDEPPGDNSGGSRSPAATGSRTGAAGVAAALRHNREVPTEKASAAEEQGRATRARMERNAETIAEEPPPDFDAAKAGVRSVSRLLKADKP